jgi:stage II sporulation protein AB (anti-sigma F factor)
MKAENSAKIQFDSLSANEAFARGAAAAFLARYDPTVPQLADIKTAVSEAVTNCIVHAYPDSIGPVTLKRSQQKRAILPARGSAAAPRPAAALRGR